MKWFVFIIEADRFLRGTKWVFVGS